MLVVAQRRTTRYGVHLAHGYVTGFAIRSSDRMRILEREETLESCSSEVKASRVILFKFAVNTGR